MRKTPKLMFIFLLFGLFSCGNNATKRFSFISDYCVLNNKETYNVGEDITLSLSLDNKYTNDYVLPSELDIYIGGKKGALGTDYNYSVTNNVGTLSLKVSDDILLRTMYDDSDNIYRITEDDFNYAKVLKNFDYYQYDLSYSQLHSIIKIYNEYSVHVSPTRRYQYSGTLNVSSSHSNYSYAVNYYEKEDNKYTNYKGDNDGWYVALDVDETEFNSVKDIPANRLVGADISAIEYTNFASNFDEITNSYLYNFKVNNIDYTAYIKFDHNKLVNISYETPEITGSIVDISLTYFESEIVIPTEAKQGTLPRFE